MRPKTLKGRSEFQTQLTFFSFNKYLWTLLPPRIPGPVVGKKIKLRLGGQRAAFMRLSVFRTRVMNLEVHIGHAHSSDPHQSSACYRSSSWVCTISALPRAFRRPPESQLCPKAPSHLHRSGLRN